MEGGNDYEQGLGEDCYGAKSDSNIYNTTVMIHIPYRFFF